MQKKELCGRIHYVIMVTFDKYFITINQSMLCVYFSGSFDNFFHKCSNKLAIAKPA